MAPIEGLLIGSRSLVTHIPLDRIPADWDVIVSPELFESLKQKHPYRPLGDNHYSMVIAKELIELHVIQHNSTSSNADLFKIAYSHEYPTIATPVGRLFNACLSMHKLLKLSSYNILHKHKNYRDLDLLDHVEIKWPDLLEKRRAETLARTRREAFFKSNVTRFVAHDDIHWWLSQALGLACPTFKHLVDKEVLVSQDTFLRSKIDIQCRALVEEAMALSMERWFIPNVVKQNVFRLWDRFLRAETSQDPCIRWLDKLCCEGAIQDHPAWLARWGNDHYGELKQLMQSSLTEIRASMPREFWHFINEVKRGRIQPT